MGAGGVQRAQHPPGRRPPAGAAGPAAAAEAGAGDRHLPGAQGALHAVLRSVPKPANAESIAAPHPLPDGLELPHLRPRQRSSFQKV